MSYKKDKKSLKSVEKRSYIFLMSSLSVLVSTSDYINFMFLISVPLPMDRIPISIPIRAGYQIESGWYDTAALFAAPVLY